MSGIDTSTQNVADIAQAWRDAGNPGVALLLTQLAAERDAALAAAAEATNRLRDFDPAEVARDIARKAQEA